MIADDNSIIREGLKKFIKWDELGFCISGEASNGAEAFEQIKETHPDALLLDIRMPVMSGLELMDILKSEKIDVHVVILSAYDEFSYAKKAIEIGAVDYILKPFSSDKIYEIFNKIRQELDKKKLNQVSSNEYISIMNDKVFNRIINGNYEKEKIAGMLEETGIKPEHEKYALIYLQANKHDEHSGKISNDREFIKDSLRNIINGIFPKTISYQIFFCEAGHLVIVLGYDGCSDEIVICGREMISKINDILSLDVKVLYKSDIYSYSLTDIAGYYENIRSLFRFRLYIKQNHMNNLASWDIGSTETGSVFTGEISNKITEFMSIGEYQKILDYIENIFIIVKNGKKLSDEEVFSIYSNFLSGLRYFLEKVHISTDMLLDFKKGSYEFDTVDKVKESLQDIFKSVSVSIEQHKQPKSNQVIVSAKDYILNHYNKHISLNDVAKYVFMHPIYFCTMFKKETGENFNEYLTQVRLTKAFDLIKSTNMKIYEISNAVGYKSTKHFSRLFKQYFGVMPKNCKNKAFIE